MKHKIISSLSLLAVMIALSSPSPAAGRHPQIEEALRALGNAKAHLEHASHDFGGHRVEAIRAIDEAARQLNICLQY